MEVELSWLRSVVQRHCPAFFLHPADRYLPCSAEFFLHHSELRAAAPGGGHAVLLPRGSVAGPLLAEAQAQLPGRRLWLELDPAARTGEPLEWLDSVPVYAHPRLVVGAAGGAEAIEIVYITIYAYNGAYKVGGLPWLQTGAHDGDIEHLTVRVHPASGALQGVWYNAHRSRDGCWVAAAQVPRCPTSGRIAAFVALHGHGTYPAVGRVFRHFFCGNDLCSAAGPAWRPRKVVLLPHVHEAGHRGLESGSGSAAKRTLMQVPSRGSLLPPAVDGAEQGGGGTDSGSSTANGSSGAANSSTPNGSSTNGSRDTSRSSSRSDPPDVLADECCAWLEFRGQWGTTDAPAVQAWFSNAEPPVSRSALQRLFLHPWPETKSL